MILYGTTHRVGDGVTADDIFPHTLPADDPAELAGACLAAIDSAIAEQAREGDILLAGDGFGAGDGAESAVLALQAAGFAAVVCASAAASFLASAEAYGLPVLACPAAVAGIAPGAIVRLDLTSGKIADRATGAIYQAPPCTPEVVATARRAQLLARTRRVVEEEGFDG